MRQGLEALGLQPDILKHDEYEVGVLIPRSLTQGKLDHLTRQLGDWNRILRGFAELSGDPERELTVRKLTSGSDQLFIVAAVSTAMVISKVIDKVLEWYTRILEIQRHRIELERLGAPVAEAKAVQKHEKELIEGEIAALARELIANAPKTLPAGRRHEVETQLVISIRHIAKFVDNGGDVEVSAPAPPQTEFQTSTDEQGQTLSQEQIDRKRAEWQAVHGKAEATAEEIARQGAALSLLGARQKPILQLGDGDPDPEHPEDKTTKRK